jgi:octaprenyl-diphosphate synthase
MTLDSLYKLVYSELIAVNAFVSTMLKADVSKVAQPVIDHILEKQGKNIRPLLCLVLYRALVGVTHDPKKEDQINHMAAALELIHMGSLIHDDIIDNADTRRNQPTVNSRWGNKSAVAVGTYLYSVAVTLLCQLDNNGVLLSATQTVKEMCDSELDQLSNRNNLQLTEAHYFRIIVRKTANLFQTNCRGTGLIGAVSSDQQTAIETFGHHLGLLFQLTDDYLDYFGDNNGHLKKKVGQDLDQGQVTLPLILLQRCCPCDTPLLTLSFDKVNDLMRQYEIDKHLQERLQLHYQQAMTALSILDDSEYRRALETLSSYILGRVQLTAVDV